MASPQEDEERSLTVLYAKRQDLLKELTDVDNQIKALEQQQQQRLQAQATHRQAALISTGDNDLDVVREVIAKCTLDQAGLREAQRAVEAACRTLDPTEVAELEAQGTTLKRRRLRNLFVHEIVKQAGELMIDPHGNYFLQRVISLLKNGGSMAPTLGDLEYNETDPNISEVLLLLEQLGSSLGEISCNMHGTRAVQRLIDHLHSVEEFELFCDLVANDLVALVKDLNGNHSISRLLVSQSFMKLGDGEGNPVLQEKGQDVRKDVYHIVASNCVEICRNRQGCCIIQRCLQWAPEPFRTEIINAALSNSLKLVQDPFGNYVVQYILDLQQQMMSTNPEEGAACNYTNAIIRQMLHNVASLSCNKFSSNVIEKCLRTASADVRQLLIDELTEPQSLPKLLTDGFANYVVQTAITTATEESQFAQLRDAIIPLQHLLKNSPYGIKIEAKLSKRHRETTKKISRQLRAQRETQRNQTSENSGGTAAAATSSKTEKSSSSSNTRSMESGAIPLAAASSQQQQQHSSSKQSKNHGHAHHHHHQQMSSHHHHHANNNQMIAPNQEYHPQHHHHHHRNPAGGIPSYMAAGTVLPPPPPGSAPGFSGAHPNQVPFLLSSQQVLQMQQQQQHQQGNNHSSSGAGPNSSHFVLQGMPPPPHGLPNSSWAVSSAGNYTATLQQHSLGSGSGSGRPEGGKQQTSPPPPMQQYATYNGAF